MLTREELIRTPCWKCWWKEGGRCYSKVLGFDEKIHKDPVNPIFLQGIEITPAHIAYCNDATAMGWEPRSDKRKMLEKFFSRLRH